MPILFVKKKIIFSLYYNKSDFETPTLKIKYIFSVSLLNTGRVYLLLMLNFPPLQCLFHFNLSLEHSSNILFKKHTPTVQYLPKPYTFYTIFKFTGKFVVQEKKEKI
jgi:hypothetical protein